ncbi:hypothetical protein AHF37_09842 [Paragonimus kellicotti]|nr:hypothetical protein AHF37_09842 [Paragonimus kellicotti]
MTSPPVFLLYVYDFSADERLVEQREARVVISSNGNTLWVPQALFKSTCEVEITYFPFDTQVSMRFSVSEFINYASTPRILLFISDGVLIADVERLFASVERIRVRRHQVSSNFSISNLDSGHKTVQFAEPPVVGFPKRSLVCVSGWVLLGISEIRLLTMLIRLSSFLVFLLYVYDFSADERLVEQREARVVISSNGNTLWVPQALFKSTCEVEITYFPFDTQVSMRFSVSEFINYASTPRILLV